MNTPRRPRTCEICEQQYVPTYYKQRTCGRSCGRWLRGDLHCEIDWVECTVCQRPLARKRRLRHGTCSKACADSVQTAASKLPPRDMSWKHEDRECPRCATVFRLADRGEYMASTTTHCSARCGKKTSKLRRKVRESGSAGEWRWSDFMRIAQRFDYCCAYCGDKPGQLDPDHVIPLAKGGPNTTSNLLPACRLCNSQKTDFLLHEWAAHRALKGQPARRTSWSVDDPRYFHLTAVRSTSVAA